MLPDSVIRVRQRHVLARIRRDFGRRSLKETFETIYDRGIWETPGSLVASGPGSSQSYAERYAALVRFVIKRFDIRTIVDLGCGDFSVGRRIVSDEISYIGVDVVRALIDENTRRFADERIHFVALDFSEMVPPMGDLALLRQVLQHLSNDEILAVLQRCSAYPLILVSEHVPASSSWTPNRDKPHGPDTRIYDGSGVVLEAPPFSVPVQEMDLHLCPHDQGGAIRTVLVHGADL